MGVVQCYEPARGAVATKNDDTRSSGPYVLVYSMDTNDVNVKKKVGAKELFQLEDQDGLLHTMYMVPETHFFTENFAADPDKIGCLDLTTSNKHENPEIHRLLTIRNNFLKAFAGGFEDDCDWKALKASADNVVQGLKAQDLKNSPELFTAVYAVKNEAFQAIMSDNVSTLQSTASGTEVAQKLGTVPGLQAAVKQPEPVAKQPEPKSIKRKVKEGPKKHQRAKTQKRTHVTSVVTVVNPLTSTSIYCIAQDYQV